MQTKTRPVTQVIDPRYVIEGADVLLRRSFGPERTNFYDPFLLFDHFAFNDPVEGPIQGFPKHPHRGIETVTYMLVGNVRHRDSIGNQGVIGPGDVQWMTSGRGILHEELPSRDQDGRIAGFQLWVNLPAAQKMSQPRYQEISEASIPVVEKPGMRVRVVAGTFDGVRGPVTEITAEPLYMDITLDPGVEFRLPVPAEDTVIAYLFEGDGVFGLDENGIGETAEAFGMLVFGRGDEIRVRGGEQKGARFMLMAGTPFKEPIFPYGPFVMNTREEIEQTLAELRNGTFIQG